MDKKPELLLVDAAVLPEIFLKVLEAKSLLTLGKAKNTSQATQMVGISRSAFYKYKDSIFHYDGRDGDSIATFYLRLEDRPGVLSSLLSEVYRAGANVVTVNQNIPVDSAAIVSLAVRTNGQLSKEDVLDILRQLDGVIEAKSI